MKDMRCVRLGLTAAVLAAVVLLVAVSHSRIASELEEANQRCIMCHSPTFNRGMEQAHLHPPFIERQCTACHLADRDWPSSSVTRAGTARVTGMVVDQKTAWRKRSVLLGSAQKLENHLAVLNGLKAEEEYRFRVVVSDESMEDAQKAVSTPWLGLRPAEVPMEEEGNPIRVSHDLALLSDLEISRANASVLFIRWETPVPSHGWLELETVGRIDVNTVGQSAGKKPEHPPLHSAEEISIRGCYSCHPLSTLGASHPVGLYSSREAQIPDDLPTVKDGMMTCVTCHDPHGAQGKMLVREKVKTKLCVACHLKFKGRSKATTF